MSVARVDVDVAILGGGCAGLSLASLLATARSPLRVAVLEQRAGYTDDRTWSGWRVRPHHFLDCVRASWTLWAVGGQDRSVVRGDGRLAYDCIPSDRFYAQALASIAPAATHTVRLGTGVRTLTPHSNHVAIETDGGLLRARLVVDTRPEPVAAGRGLLQTFAGVEVETEQPCFQADTVGLMAFEAGCADAVTFLYTLPFSPTRALLELTDMAPRQGMDLPERLSALLAQRLCCPYRVIRSEAGCLPMRPYEAAAAVSGRVVRLGTLGGATRASTGYAFATIQCQAEALAARLAHGTEAAFGWRAPAPALWMRVMDRLFLTVLRRRPDLGPHLLTALFARCPPAALVRFLGGTGRITDGALVALSMPAGPFLRALA